MSILKQIRHGLGQPIFDYKSTLTRTDNRSSVDNIVNTML